MKPLRSEKSLYAKQSFSFLAIIKREKQRQTSEKKRKTMIFLKINVGNIGKSLLLQPLNKQGAPFFYERAPQNE